MALAALASGDGPAARRLWEDLGGWYRTTSPASDRDVDRAIDRLLRSPGRRRTRRSGPAEAAWIWRSNGVPTGWLYARADAEQNYIVPLLAPEGGPEVLGRLLVPAREWFRNEGAHQFFVDVPVARTDILRAVEAEGRPRWRRSVDGRDLSPVPGSSSVPGPVREFRRSDLGPVQALFEQRHPEPLPPPIPVAFLELRAGWFRDPAWELERAVWVAGASSRILGVAGGTHLPGSPIGFLGPWVLSEEATVPILASLLESVIGWLRVAGAREIRTTVPTPPSEDARALRTFGFVSVAESELYELRV
jgi:hypothetical protein